MFHVEQIVLALFPCMCYRMAMNEATYRRALGALRARKPLLMAAASDHALRMAPLLSGQDGDSLRRALWLELVWACRVWQGWGGAYA
jgi:hypothetical protein